MPNIEKILTTTYRDCDQIECCRAYGALIAFLITAPDVTLAGK